jgi:DNA-binding PadR family transcriptional regulator
VENMWESDQRVLAAVVELYERNGHPLRVGEVRAALGDEPDDDALTQSLRRLAEHGYIDAKGSWQGPILRIHKVTEKGLRASGFWPSKEEAFERMLLALEEAVEREPDPENKSKLKALLVAARSAGRDIFVDFVSSALTSGVGLG